MGSGKSLTNWKGVTPEQQAVYDLIMAEVYGTVPPNPNGGQVITPGMGATPGGGQTQRPPKQEVPPSSNGNRGIAPTQIPIPMDAQPPALDSNSPGSSIQARKTFNESPAGIMFQLNELAGKLNDPNFPAQLKPGIRLQVDQLNKQLQGATETKYQTRTMDDGTKLRSADGGKTFDYSYDGLSLIHI